MVDKKVLAKRRAQSRRRLTPREIPYAERLGALLREYRLALGITIVDLALLAQVSEKTISRIETAERRTRESTLRRIVGVMKKRAPGLDDEAVLDELIEAAGIALAPEASAEHQVNIDKHRARRTEKKIEAIFEWEREKQARKIERYYQPNRWKPLKGPDGKFMPRHPTPEQLKAIAKRYRLKCLFVPPLDENGNFIEDDPMMDGQTNSRRWWSEYRAKQRVIADRDRRRKLRQERNTPKKG